MKTGTIIIIYGTSSSGKSSIVKALQSQLEEPPTAFHQLKPGGIF